MKIAILLIAATCAISRVDAQDKTESGAGAPAQHAATALTPKPPTSQNGVQQQPDASDAIHLSNDAVAALNAAALTQYCKSVNQYTEECLKSGKYFDLEKFNNRTVAKSKGQLVKLVRGTLVRVLERSRPCAKIEAEDAHHRRNIYIIMDLQLASDDSPPDLPKLPFEKRAR